MSTERKAERIRKSRVNRSIFPPHEEFLFVEPNDYCTIRYQGHVASLKSERGLHYLAVLLRDPGRGFHVTDFPLPTFALPRNVTFSSTISRGASMSPCSVQPVWSSQRSVTKILPSTVPRTFYARAWRLGFFHQAQPCSAAAPLRSSSCLTRCFSWRTSKLPRQCKRSNSSVTFAMLSATQMSGLYYRHEFCVSAMWIDSPRGSRALSEVYAFDRHCCLWRHQ